MGALAFKAHKDFKTPATIHISINAGRWYVSFNYDDHIAEPTDKDNTAYLLQFNAAELQTMAVGFGNPSYKTVRALAVGNSLCL